jgi:serine/threonine protein phosphatase PrpC
MIYIQSKTGGRTENQDFYGTAKTPYGELIVVCDGMGGHNGGRHAAEKAVQIILNSLLISSNKKPVEALNKAIENANSFIWKESQSFILGKGMGTTVVALLLTPDKAICAHVGDSRIYQLKEGKILHRTFDHSHVFELVKAGLINEEQARLSEKSNIITRGLGIRATVDIEITDNLSYQKGDRFLLCTDGIWGAVPENELVEMVSQKSDIETIITQLVDKIDAIGFENGGRHDNLTAALFEIESSSIIQNSEVKQSGSTKKIPTSRSKRLIYLLLILLLGSMVVDLCFVMQKKPVVKKIEKKMIIKHIHKEKQQTADSSNQSHPSKNENNQNWKKS